MKQRRERFFNPVSSTLKINNIAIVTIPTAGHIKILRVFVEEARKNNPHLNFRFVLTSWSEHTIREADLKALKEASNNDLIILESYSTAHCKEVTFGRVRELLGEVVKACFGFDLIIYDFIAPEGYLAGKLLSIPTICTEPSYIGDFDTSSEEYHNQLKASQEDINAIEKQYQLDFRDELKLVSGTFSTLSPQNVVFSWEKFIRVGDFEKNQEEKKKSCCFMRPSPKDISPLLDDRFAYLNQGKKVVYFSLGTIASGVVWEELEGMKNNNLRDFIRLLYSTILTTFRKRQDLILIISTGRPVEDLVSEAELTESIHVYETVPQADLLYHVDLFITHCGANGANEAIDAETPMIGIPLMFDQHRCAGAIKELGLGEAFSHSREKWDDAVNFGAPNEYFRAPFYPNNTENAQKELEETIDRVLAQDYSNAFAQVKSAQTFYFDSVPQLLKSYEEQLLKQQANESEAEWVPG